MAFEEFLILRCLAPPGTARRAGRPGGGLALRDAATGGGCLRRRVALIRPLGNWITTSFRGGDELDWPAI
jgi:hypothetical protein